MDEWKQVLSRCPKLNRRDITLLYWRWAVGDQAARTELILSQLPLAFASALARHNETGVALEDLVGRANLAVVQAVDSWSPKGMPLPSHVKTRVRYAMLSAPREEALIPCASSGPWRTLAHISHLLLDETSVQRIAELSGISERKVETALQAKAASSVRELSPEMEERLIQENVGMGKKEGKTYSLRVSIAISESDDNGKPIAAFADWNAAYHRLSYSDIVAMEALAGSMAEALVQMGVVEADDPQLPDRIKQIKG
jgi:DNA-directed RNA polymerase specialized sigma subunit